MKGLIKRTNTFKSPKSFKGDKSQEEGCSRVGSSFQAQIPEYTEEIDCYDSKNPPHKEFSVWMPNQQPNAEELNSYLEFAKQYEYTQELAMILLHWHNYDIEKAIDDIPNYSPAYSKWTKNEVKKFLRCIDSKPRKDFVEAKRTVPGRRMGDICALYYSIAAPFKAGNRSKYHNQLIEQCYSRAVRAGLVTCRWRKSSSIEETLVNTPKPELTEDPLEGEIKSFLVNLVGASKATDLLGNELLSSPQRIQTPIVFHSPAKSIQSASPSSPIKGSSASVRLENDLSPTTMPTTNAYQTSSSEASSENDSDSICQGKGKGHSLPSGAYYDHEEFLTFLNMTNDQLLQEKETELSYLQRINEELREQMDITEARSRSVLHNMDLLKPNEGFPKISYRWTKTDLAFVLTAMSKYGYDFATIAQNVGTKSESFIRDFYNRFRDRFTLDSIIK
ncbi:unnamed protein product [Trichobilharzia szidati]|nr:unnamed protein product [Trichobilharzia szidati]